MNVLYLSSIGEIGGAERALLDLMAGLKSAHSDWRLGLLTGGEGAMMDEARTIGVTAAAVPMPAALAALGDAAVDDPIAAQAGMRHLPPLLRALPEGVRYVRELRRAIVETEPDIVHSNGFKMHLLAAWAMPRGLPLVWHLHDYLTSRPLMSRLIPAHARRCAMVITNSKSIAHDAAEMLRDKRIFTVYNAVDLRRFAPKGALLDLDALAGLPPLPEGGLRVGLVATMARWKGHATFLQALSALPPAPVRGYVIGGPIYRTAGSQHALDDLRQTAMRLGLADRVGFTGFVADSAAAMRSLDIVVHASTAPEPFGLVVAEAMACGRAVIASAAGGVAELIEDGVTALTHRPGDHAALSTLIVRLAGDRDLRIRLGNAARASAERLFRRERMAAEIAPIYRELAPRAA